MAELNKIYRCGICGNVVSVLEAGKGELVCCGQPMKMLEEKTAEQEGKEKHVPVIETIEGGVRVKVGSVPHPMEENHHIGLIQLVKDGNVVIGKRLKPGDGPAAEFCCLADTEGLKARILCNVHGLWVN
ncbi:desulfoferrodoxin [Candidatus Woesearchaeota archaeon]|nr:desulfoferrodoxin [Candidatus Woesearchaeota archaeon]